MGSAEELSCGSTDPLLGSRVILLAGPTASGKTDLAIRLAKRIGIGSCVIINVDSLQVYDRISVLTARPTFQQELEVPHRLFGFVNPSERFSVGAWLDAVRVELARAEREGMSPILVGGTGLYFHALLRGLSPIPLVPEKILSAWKRKAKHIGKEGLHSILLDRDPKMAASLRVGDMQRMIRSLSILEATGRSLSEWWEDSPGQPVLRLEECSAFVLNPDPIWLRGRISERFDSMLESGILEEIRFLKEQGFEDSLPIMRALGVPELMEYLSGEVDFETAVRKAKTATWRYAKRQRTWFRNQMVGWTSLGSESSEPCWFEQIEQKLFSRQCEDRAV